ncbi:MAG: hypothetical protein Q9165_002991 [Trypethelium subeluteriae]
MPRSTINNEPSRRTLPEPARQISSEGIHNQAQSGHLRPLPSSQQSPIPDDAWEIWYVSLSIGRSANRQDVLAWREQQARLESQGLQDPIDYSAWMMVKAALQEQERGIPTSEQDEEWRRSQRSHGHISSRAPYSGLSADAHPTSGMQEQINVSHASAETGGNRLDRPQSGLLPSHEDDSLLRRVVRREHARAASNFNVKVTPLSPVSGELTDPPASAPAATISFGSDTFRNQSVATEQSAEQRRALSGPLAKEIGNFSTRAGQRNRSREVLPPFFQYEPRKTARTTGERKSSSTIANRRTSGTTSEPNLTVPTSYVPPNKRGGEKPWLSRNWRQT